MLVSFRAYARDVDLTSLDPRRGTGNRDRARPRGRPGGVRRMGSDHQAGPALLLDDVLRLLEGIPLDGDRRLAPPRPLRVPAPRSRQPLPHGRRPAPAAGG